MFLERGLEVVDLALQAVDRHLVALELADEVGEFGLVLGRLGHGLGAQAVILPAVGIAQLLALIAHLLGPLLLESLLGFLDGGQVLLQLLDLGGLGIAFLPHIHDTSPLVFHVSLGLGDLLVEGDQAVLHLLDALLLGMHALLDLGDFPGNRGLFLSGGLEVPLEYFDVATEQFEILLVFLDFVAGLVHQALEVIELPQDQRHLGLVPLLRLLLVVLGLLLLLLVLLDFRVDATSPVELEVLVLGCFLGNRLQTLVLCLVLQAPRDLLDQACQVLRRLRGNRFDISLEDQEVARFDQNVLRLQRVVVLLGRDDAVVDAVLACALVRDRALPFLLVAGIVFVDSHDPRRLRVVPRGLLRGLVFYLVRVPVRLPVSGRCGGSIVLDF